MPSWKKVLISGSDAALNSLNITAALTASGIIYPSVDGTSGQVLTTDGSGHLSFTTVSSGETGTGASVKLSQTVAATTWSFSHNLNEKFPAVTIYDSNDEVIIPQKIDAVDNNNMLVYFSTPRTGTAAAVVGGTTVSASYSLTAVTASYALTASYLEGFASSFPYTGSAEITGSFGVTGSTYLGKSSADRLIITGSQYIKDGTLVVLANNTVMDDYVDGYFDPGQAIIASGSVTATHGFTGSLYGNADTATTASYAHNSNTASYALTASYLEGLVDPFPYTGSATVSGSLQVTGSVSSTNGFAGFLQGNADTATSASYAQTSTYSTSTVSASYAESATNASYASQSATALSSSYALVADNLTPGSKTIVGDLTVEGKVTAQEFHTEYISSSVVYQSGSTKFGDTIEDVHSFTGSLEVQGGITGSVFGTASWATHALTASYLEGYISPFPFTGSATISGSLQVTGSTSLLGQLAISDNLHVGDSTSDRIIVTGSQYIKDGALVILANNNFGDDYADGYFLPGQAIVASGSVVATQGFSGSLQGNADTATSASYALSSSYSTTASYAETATSASYALSSSYAISASYSQYAVTSSYAVSASYATTSSFSLSSQNAQDILIYVKNTTGAQINKGTVVRILDSIGDNALIATASYDSEGLSANTLGITNQNILNDGFGYVMTEGTFLGLNTDVYVAGQLLYLGAGGTITGTAPIAPLHAVRLGQVLRVQQNNGSMYVRIDNGYELGELHNVKDTSNGSSYGDLLMRSSSVWINTKQLSGSYGLTGALSATSFVGPLTGNASTATTASHALTASSLNPLYQNVEIHGNLQVYGTSSFTYVTSSQLDVQQSFISVNVFEPAERFGGIKVYDSGSSTATASLAWDSLHNHWVYENASGSTYSGGMLLAGPRNTGSLGDEPNLTRWMVARSDGGDHLDNSQIYSSGSVTQITGSLTVTQGITGSLLGTATSASYASNGGVTQIIAGTNISLSPSTGVGAVTISSTGGTLGSNTTASFSNSSTWTFAHNLGNQYAVIQTVDSSGNQIIPQNIAYTSPSTATITFPSNETGVAIASVGGVGTTAATASFVNTLSQTVTLSGSFNQAGSITQTGTYGGISIGPGISSAMINVSGSNTLGGAGYVDFLKVINTATGATNRSTTFRKNITGGIEMVNSTYSNTVLTIDDSGSLNSQGNLNLNGSYGVTMPNRPAFRVWGNGSGIAATTVLSGTNTVVEYNQGSAWNNATGTFTAPVAGLYQVNIVARTAANNNSGINQVLVRKNSGGALTTQVMLEWAANTSTNHIGGSTISKLAVGDTLQAIVTAGSISFDGNDSFSVAYIG